MQEQEQEQRRRHHRIRAIATGLLVAMAMLFLVAHLLRGRYPWLVHVGAFAEAAMVGALADWFAVTALFRHPLGLPIPHTAIIARNKDRIGASVANFLEYNFMTREVLFEELKPIDFAGAAASWLAVEANSRTVAAELVAGLPSVIRMVEDEDVARLIQSATGSALARVRLAPVVAEVASVLIADQRHLLLFDRILTMAANVLENNRGFIREKIHEKSPRWLPRMVDEKLFEKLLAAIHETIAGMREEGSPWRAQFQQAAQELIARLKDDPEYEERIKRALSGVVHHPLFLSYSEQFWQLVRQRLMEQAESPDSPLAGAIERGLRALAEGLRDDPAVQARLNDWLRSFIADAVAARRHAIAGLVRRVIEKWDADTIAEKFELYVGRDLQYIRINGTVVGGLVGLGLHFLTLAL
ncbi:DUF445 domain-containing protein [Lacisediminimonas profundi]|uniref:DUF445 domain-containing protein n=1 Tax=Lacisediminimonas profundi TaxID=2603856 RepID=UPI00124AFEB5|nr:DUF445 domain-containing protein [Lacisediminimonas profundi]